MSTRGRTITGSAQLCSDLANGTNPVFFVSSSPWDLHNSYVTFIRHTGPGGPGCCSATCSAPPPVASRSRVASRRSSTSTLGCGSCSSAIPGPRIARSTPPSLERIRDGSSRSISARFGATRAMVGWRRSRTPWTEDVPLALPVNTDAATGTRSRSASSESHPGLGSAERWAVRGDDVATHAPVDQLRTPTSCPSRRGPRRRCRGCRGARRCTASRRRRHLAGSVPS